MKTGLLVKKKILASSKKIKKDMKLNPKSKHQDLSHNNHGIFSV